MTSRSLLALLAVSIFGLAAHAARDANGEAAPAPAPVTTSPSPFAYVDVFIDPHGIPLAAYQFELRATAGEVKLVGIEGGDDAAFGKPPYYDPKALLDDRVVIAAFNTSPADKLPAANTRVARLMVHSQGTKPSFEVKLHVAASADGAGAASRAAGADF